MCRCAAVLIGAEQLVAQDSNRRVRFGDWSDCRNAPLLKASPRVCPGRCSRKTAFVSSISASVVSSEECRATLLFLTMPFDNTTMSSAEPSAQGARVRPGGSDGERFVRRRNDDCRVVGQS